MKKIIALVLIGLVIVAHNAFAPEIPKNRLLGFDLDNYVNCFSDGVPPNDKSRIRVVMNYYRNTQGTHKDAVAQFAQLEGDPNRVDTALEWLCASYYHIAIRDIRPPEAEAILPADNPKLADQKIGAAVFQEMQILRFLGDTAAVSRYEAMLKFITDRKNATRQEIEAFYRDNVRALIAGVVDEEFNRISFVIRDTAVNETYSAVLTRNSQNGEYVLSYDQKKLTAPSLEALSSEMSKRPAEFSQSSVNELRTQAALIPAVVYADWKSKGVANGVDGMALINEVLTNFYLNPSKDTYDAVVGIYARYLAQIAIGDRFADVAIEGYIGALKLLNEAIARQTIDHPNMIAAVRVPNDRRFNIFLQDFRR